MRAALGSAAVGLGAVASLAGAVCLLLGLRGDRRWRLMAKPLAALAFGAAVVAVAAMEWALLTRDFSVSYVASSTARATPVLYTVASLWGRLEGSILLWTLVLTGFVALLARRLAGRVTKDGEAAWALVAAFAVSLFFFALMLGPADPFRVSAVVPTDGAGPNPLLQNHPLMAFHPPILYIGYVGFTVPFAYAIGALVTGRVSEGWLVETRRWTLLAWGFLTAGIILGAWWSYEVLGWGGFWAWDPVENASLLPWLTATAYLHSVVVQERRGMLRVWNLSLIGATFWLTILATFLTRSGVLNSVHSFTASPIGPVLLGFVGVGAAVLIGLIAWRADDLRAPSGIDSMLSREAAFLGNNLLFAGFAFVVLVGTVFPLFAEAIRGEQLSVGEPYFNQMTAPLGLGLLFLMAVGPALPWRATKASVLSRRLTVPAWAAALTMAGLVAAGVRGVADVAAFGLAAFALSTITRQVVLATRARRRVTHEGRVVAFGRLIVGNRRLYGGLIVHVGVVLVAVAFTASRGFDTNREIGLNKGQATAVAGYRLTYLGPVTTRSAQKTTVAARVAVERDGRRLGVYAPALSKYPNMTQAVGTPSVRSGLVRDLYLTLVSAPSTAGRVVVGVRVNPLVMWLWIGGAVMASGTAFAAWPVRRSAVRVRTAPEERVPELLTDGAA